MKCFTCSHDVAEDLVYPGWYHCAWCLKDFPSDEVILELPAPYECHLCNKATFDPPKEVPKGCMGIVEVSVCRECKEVGEIRLGLKKGTGSDEMRRMQKEDYFNTGRLA